MTTPTHIKHGTDLAELIYWEMEHGSVKTASIVKAALEAVLLFHSGSPWGPEERLRWHNCCAYVYRENRDVPATTKELCNLVRTALTTIENVQ